jgi:hypothetical protein
MSNFKFLLSEPGFASFADVAVAVEIGLKVAFQQTFDKLELLKKSLMQEYFG